MLERVAAVVVVVAAVVVAAVDGDAVAYEASESDVAVWC